MSQTVTAADLEALAQRLDDAQTSRADTPSLERDPNVTVQLDVQTAYRVQDALVGLRTGRGERMVGVKLGFTSKAKMAQMGVSDVIVGRLTDAMAIPNGGQTDLARYIHPKVEPEVAYRLARDVDLDAPDTDILTCVDAVAPALEIIDSRYRDFQFTYSDVVADNTSASGFAVGAWVPLRDAAGLEVTMTVGDEVTRGSTSAILGDPAEALRELLKMCRRHRIALRAGDVVLAGAATAATVLTATTAHCEVAGLGSVGFTATRG